MWFKKDKQHGRSRMLNPSYGPNKAEVAHFVRKFRKRRMRQRWLSLLFFLLPAILVASFQHFRESLFRDGNWSEPSVMTVVIVGLLIIAEVAIIVISVVNWRCPHCENRVPYRPHPMQCEHCGAKLRFTKTSEPDPPPSADAPPPSDPPASADARPANPQES